ncbi:hypothetical protein AT59_14770 [Aeromonas hydrophila AD9]|nr:hypothetical protein AT59_14770 [Aeromonas hydrophila AD9]
MGAAAGASVVAGLADGGAVVSAAAGTAAAADGTAACGCAGVLADAEAATAPLVAAAAEAEGSVPCAWLVSNGGVSKQRRPTRVMGFIIRISCSTLLSAAGGIPLGRRRLHPSP